MAWLPHRYWEQACLRRLLACRVRGFAQFVADADVVHHQSVRLVAEDPVHARDGLDDRVAAHRLVDVERVQARDVRPGEPHVDDDDELERVVGIDHALLDRVPQRFCRQVSGFAPGSRVFAEVPGHHDLDLRAAG